MVNGYKSLRNVALGGVLAGTMALQGCVKPEGYVTREDIDRSTEICLDVIEAKLKGENLELSSNFTRSSLDEFLKTFPNVQFADNGRASVYALAEEGCYLGGIVTDKAYDAFKGIATKIPKKTKPVAPVGPGGGPVA